MAMLIRRGGGMQSMGGGQVGGGNVINSGPPPPVGGMQPPQRMGMGGGQGRYQPLPNFPAGPGVQQGFGGYQGGSPGGMNPRAQAQDNVSLPPMNQPPNVHRRVGGRRGWAGGPGTHYVPPGAPQGMHTPAQPLGEPGGQVGGPQMTPPNPIPIGAGGGAPGGFQGGPAPASGVFQGGPAPQNSLQDQARIMGQRKAMQGMGSMF